MKRKTKIKLTIIFILLVLAIAFYFSGLYNDLKIKTINLFENTLNRTGLELIKGKGSLINDNDISSLDDSKITGEDITIDSSSNVYYSILENKEKKLYKQVYANIIDLKTSFKPVVDVNNDEIDDSIEAVYNDHPELFWINTNYSYKYISTGKVVQISLSYNSTSKNIEESKTIFNDNLNEIINNANKYNTDYEKEKYVHDTLIENNEYDENAKLTQSAYSALVNHKTVCAGYSRAFQLIMNKLGVTTYYVTGSSSGDHAWNIIKLDDDFYNVDLTWDDQKTISYRYFNMPDSLFSKTHIRNELSIYLPVCRGTKYYNYEEKQKIEKTNEKVEEEEQENPIIDNDEESEETIVEDNTEISNEEESNTESIVEYYDESGNLIYRGQEE